MTAKIPGAASHSKLYKVTIDFAAEENVRLITPKEEIYLTASSPHQALRRIADYLEHGDQDHIDPETPLTAINLTVELTKQEQQG